MPVKRTLIRCPHCARALEDIGQEDIVCRFCGKSFKRSEITKGSEDFLRKQAVITLTSKIKTERVALWVSIIIGSFITLFGILFLFSKVFGMLELIFCVVFLSTGISWLVASVVLSKKLESDRSKMFDLAGTRRLQL
jgi:hypothetical protein